MRPLTSSDPNFVIPTEAERSERSGGTLRFWPILLLPVSDKILGNVNPASGFRNPSRRVRMNQRRNPSRNHQIKG